MEQALYERRPSDSLIHHSDRGSQYVSIKYTERLADAGLEPSVGTVGDSYDTALAETMIGLFKAEVIHRLGPWKSADAVEWETLKWVDWFNNRRLLEPIGYITPAEAEEAFYAIGQGASTQTALFLVTMGLFDIEPLGFSRDVLMVGAWAIKLAIAEFLIRRAFAVRASGAVI